MLRRNGASPAISSLALLHPLSPGSSAYTGGVGGPIIKGPDDPTSQLLPNSRNSGWSGTEKAGKTWKKPQSSWILPLNNGQFWMVLYVQARKIPKVFMLHMIDLQGKTPYGPMICPVLLGLVNSWNLRLWHNPATVTPGTWNKLVIAIYLQTDKPTRNHPV